MLFNFIPIGLQRISEAFRTSVSSNLTRWKKKQPAYLINVSGSTGYPYHRHFNLNLNTICKS